MEIARTNLNDKATLMLLDKAYQRGFFKIVSKSKVTMIYAAVISWCTIIMKMLCRKPVYHGKSQTKY